LKASRVYTREAASGSTRAESRLCTAFKHDFADGTVVDAKFQMRWVAPHIFRVSVAGAALGYGYLLDGYCHYHLETGQAFVEASYRITGDTIDVFG